MKLEKMILTGSLAVSLAFFGCDSEKEKIVDVKPKDMAQKVVQQAKPKTAKEIARAEYFKKYCKIGSMPYHDLGGDFAKLRDFLDAPAQALKHYNSYVKDRQKKAYLNLINKHLERRKKLRK